MKICVYCGKKKGSKIGCCGENQWDDIPECPRCHSEFIETEDDGMYLCSDCKLNFTHTGKYLLDISLLPKHAKAKGE